MIKTDPGKTMNNTPQENNQDKSSLPSVYQMDLPKREEFLSQVGSFTQEQRRIFHRICDFFDPMLDYNRFVLHAGRDILFANNQIEILMKKIRNAHYGLLKFRNIDGELKPDRIVITDRDSRIFYQNLVEDEIQRILLDESRGLLSLDELDKMNIRIPFDMVETIYPEQLSPGFLQAAKEEGRIFTIPLKTGGSVVATSGSLETIVEVSRSRIKNSLNNASFISTVSRYMGLKISEIQKKQYTRERSFWMNCASEVLKNREDLQLRIKHISFTVFQYCEILHHFYNNSLAEEEKRREEEKAKQIAIDEVCMEILKKENFLVSPDELLKYLQPYEKKWPGFKDLFYENAVKISGKIGLPLILYISDRYLHRDHVYPFFRSELSIQTKELKTHYIHLMERMLRTNNKDKISVFYSRDTFKDDVLEEIRGSSPILAEFLSKPRIVSEGIVHYFKNLKKVRDINKIKDFMNNFFDEGVIRFKDTDYLLNLYLLDIFNESYRYLTWWKRFVLKLSGKHESFISQFTGISEENKDIPEIMSETLKRKKRPESPGGYGREKLRRDEEPRSEKLYYRRKTGQEKNQIKYNIRQRDKAWEEFQDAFNKKKR